ncbi:MAG: GerAB/ArcD/ProY family transporter [Tumebacillaceae bacterium]
MLVNSQRISSSELLSLMVVFMIGTALLFPKGGITDHNSWISVSFAVVAGILLTTLYAAISDAMPGLTIIEIGEELLGAWFGKLIGILYLWYSFHIGTIVLKNLEELISTVLLQQTPTFVIDASIMVLVVWGVYAGIEVVARCALIILGIIVLLVVSSFLLLLHDMEAGNLLPLIGDGWSNMLRAATTITSFPYGESVLFLMVFPCLNQAKETKKTVRWAAIITGILLLIDELRNVLIFGDLITNIHFPSFTAIAFISIADFLERIESFGLLIWVFGCFIKICICLFVSTRCLSQIVGTQHFRDTRVYIVPVGLLVLEMAQFIYRSAAEMAHFSAHVWTWYSLPFQLVLPLLLLITLKLKRKKAPIS